MRERIEAVLHRLEDLAICLERDLCSPTFCDPNDIENPGRFATFVTLPMNLPVTPNLKSERLGQCVNNRESNPMQSTRYLVTVVVELSAGVQHG